MALYRIGRHSPSLASGAFVAPGASLIGQVTLGEGASVWFGAVLRGDNEPTRIGRATNVQEGAILHADPGFALEIGDNVTIGHQAMLHGCTVGDGCLIGIQAVVLNGAVLGRHCLVGAGAIVTEGKRFADRSLILGAPAEVVRELTDDDVAKLDASAHDYENRAAEYVAGLERID